MPESAYPPAAMLPVRRSTVPGRPLAWIGLTLLALGYHALLTWQYADRAWTTSCGVGALLVIALALTLGCAWHAECELRPRWWLLAAAFALWIAGYAAIAKEQLAGTDASHPLTFLLIFVLHGLPWFLALAYASDRNMLPHTRFFDVAQTALFGIAAIVLFFPDLIVGMASPPSTGYVDHYYDVVLISAEN